MAINPVVTTFVVCSKKKKNKRKERRNGSLWFWVSCFQPLWPPLGWDIFQTTVMTFAYFQNHTKTIEWNSLNSITECSSGLFFSITMNLNVFSNYCM